MNSIDVRDGLPGGTVLLLAMGASAATATSYVVQPDLVAIADDLNSAVSVVGLASAGALFGYLVGLAFAVPLVDLVRADRLLLVQFAGAGSGLLLAASATSVVMFTVGLFISGVAASCGAQMSSLVARRSSVARRGRSIGTVTAGISAAILIGRFAGGLLSEIVGWRLMLVCFSAGALVCGLSIAVAVRYLPRPTATEGYGATLRSMPGLFITHRLHWVSAAGGAL